MTAITASSVLKARPLSPVVTVSTRAPSILRISKVTPGMRWDTDQDGYAYVDTLELTGKVYLRELANKGYIVDEQLKTVYVKPGETTEITWKNTPIMGQIQIWKKSLAISEN